MKGYKFIEDPDKLFELTKTMKIIDIAKIYNVNSQSITKKLKGLI